MKTFKLKFLATILILGVVFIGCNDDDDDDPFGGGPDDTTIPIDATQAFNMKNFIASFEQIFEPRERYAWSYSHEYVNGKATETFQNYILHGEFGENIYKIEHTFNSDGIITSSYRFSPTYQPNEDAIVYTYKFDLEGYIIELTETIDGSVKNITKFEYNEQYQLTRWYVEETKKAVKLKTSDSYGGVFTYDVDGNVATYFEDSGWTYLYEYTYSNGNMVKKKRTYNSSSININIYEYDSQGRLIKEYGEGSEEDRYEYEYLSDILRIVSYDNDLKEAMYDYGEGFVHLKRWIFEYDGDIFEYCTTEEYGYDYNYDNYKYIVKEEYFEGTVSNLVLVGYVAVDSRDAAENRKTKESIYDANGTLLYYVEYSVSGWDIIGYKIYLANGTQIYEPDIAEDWVFILVDEIRRDG